MAATDTVSGRPTVSVVIPARNEEACLGSCLDSLLAQRGVAFEVIVVDDHSTDRTREIALSFGNPQIRVIEAGPLPDGWTGKNNAVTAGSKAARGEWLLFTDADTIHLPGSLARSLDEAKRHSAAMLSYSPEQVVKTFAEKAVMPVIFAELAAAYRPSQVSDPSSPAAAANGQYILITREAYDAVGGHAAVASDLLEDVALARLVKHSGRKLFFRYAADAVRTRMYRTFAQLREGWTKNLALLFPRPRALAFLRSAEFLLIVGNLAAAIWAELSGRPNLAVQTTLLTIILSGWFWLRIRKAHFSALSSLAAILGLPMFSYLLWKSITLGKKGGITWKGREYLFPEPKAGTRGFDDRTTHIA